jgi:hypothetical protein
MADATIGFRQLSLTDSTLRRGQRPRSQTTYPRVQTSKSQPVDDAVAASWLIVPADESNRGASLAASRTRIHPSEPQPDSKGDRPEPRRGEAPRGSTARVVALVVNDFHLGNQSFATGAALATWLRRRGRFGRRPGPIAGTYLQLASPTRFALPLTEGYDPCPR